MTKPLYSPEEVFDLLAKVDCLADVQAIAAYLSKEVENYTELDNTLFLGIITMYTDILI